jgi:hypothetical protein
VIIRDSVPQCLKIERKSMAGVTFRLGSAMTMKHKKAASRVGKSRIKGFLNLNPNLIFDVL